MLMSSVHAEIRDNQYWSKIFSIFTGRHSAQEQLVPAQSGLALDFIFRTLKILLIISHAIDKETF